MWGWIGVIGVAAVLLYLLDREIYFYEATHLSPRIQGWLYDRWAARYDAGKRESQAQDGQRLARPLLARLGDMPDPRVLDFATGTGRLPLALLKDEAFQGHIIAMDISEGMLAQAARKLAAYPQRVELVLMDPLPLPFADGSFDVVSCLEALEVMPAMDAPLAELSRVLRPGGIFITSRGTEQSGRKMKVLTPGEFTQLLERHGFEQVEIQPWWKFFDLVWARKSEKG